MISGFVNRVFKKFALKKKRRGRPQILEHSKICGLSPLAFAGANDTSPYRAERGKGRLWNRYSANSYSSANFERKVF